MVSKAQKQATTKYENKVYSKICIRIREDRDGVTREAIQQAASSQNKSTNEYIIDAIREKLNGSEAEPIPEIIREPYYD